MRGGYLLRGFVSLLPLPKPGVQLGEVNRLTFSLSHSMPPLRHFGYSRSTEVVVLVEQVPLPFLHSDLMAQHAGMGNVKTQDP